VQLSANVLTLFDAANARHIHMREHDNACVYLKTLQCSFKSAAHEVKSVPIDRIIFIAYEDLVELWSSQLTSWLTTCHAGFFFITNIFVVTQ